MLNVTLNEQQKGDYFALMTEDGGFLLKADDLRDIGMVDPSGETSIVAGETYISLGSMEGVGYSFDRKTLTLEITARPDLLPKRTIDMAPRRLKNVYYPRDDSLFLNYGLSYSNSSPSTYEVFSLSNELGVRHGDFLFLADSIYSRTRQEATTDNRFVRLLSSLIHENRALMVRTTVGDFVTEGGDTAPSVNMGGLSIQKLYRIDPYFLHYPAIDLSGYATLPSQLELNIDGWRVLTDKVYPGEFDVSNIYTYGGRREIELVLRDSLGREHRITQMHYLSTELLKEGLSEYSYGIGFLRDGFGRESNSYGKAAVSAFHRIGMDDRTTLGYRAGWAGDVINLGPQASFLVGNLGAARLSYSFSQDGDAGKTGHAGTARFEHLRRAFNLRLGVTAYSRQYRAFSEDQTTDVNYEATATVSVSFREVGSFSASANTTKKYLGPDMDIYSLTYSKSLGRRTTLFSRLSRTESISSETELFVGITHRFGGDYSVSTQVKVGEDRSSLLADFQKRVPYGEGISFRVPVERTFADGDGFRLDPHVQYKAKHGIYRLEFGGDYPDSGDSSTTYTLSAAGAIAYVGRTWGATRPVTDSFALVKLDGLEDISVFVNNQEAGKTDRSGRVFLPEFASYINNPVSVSDVEVPISYSIDNVLLEVSPPLRSGTVIDFKIQKFQAVTGRLIMSSVRGDTPVEFTEVRFGADGELKPFVTATEGVFYLENVGAGRFDASFELDGAACSFVLEVPESDEVIIDLGDVYCRTTQVPYGLLTGDEESDGRPHYDPDLLGGISVWVKEQMAFHIPRGAEEIFIEPPVVLPLQHGEYVEMFVVVTGMRGKVDDDHDEYVKPEPEVDIAANDKIAAPAVPDVKAAEGRPAVLMSRGEMAGMETMKHEDESAVVTEAETQEGAMSDRVPPSGTYGPDRLDDQAISTGPEARMEEADGGFMTAGGLRLAGSDSSSRADKREATADKGVNTYMEELGSLEAETISGGDAMHVAKRDEGLGSTGAVVPEPDKETSLMAGLPGDGGGRSGQGDPGSDGQGDNIATGTIIGSDIDMNLKESEDIDDDSGPTVSESDYTLIDSDYAEEAKHEVVSHDTEFFEEDRATASADAALSGDSVTVGGSEAEELSAGEVVGHQPPRIIQGGSAGSVMDSGISSGGTVSGRPDRVEAKADSVDGTAGPETDLEVDLLPETIEPEMAGVSEERHQIEQEGAVEVVGFGTVAGDAEGKRHAIILEEEGSSGDELSGRKPETEPETETTHDSTSDSPSGQMRSGMAAAGGVGEIPGDKRLEVGLKESPGGVGSRSGISGVFGGDKAEGSVGFISEAQGKAVSDATVEAGDSGIADTGEDIAERTAEVRDKMETTFEAPLRVNAQGSVAEAGAPDEGKKAEGLEPDYTLAGVPSSDKQVPERWDNMAVAVFPETTGKTEAGAGSNESSEPGDVEQPMSVIRKLIHFPFDSTVPYDEDDWVLSSTVSLMLENPALKADIEGHADQNGPEAYNYELGLKRAIAVRDYLLSNHIDGARIRDLVSYGETRLLCTGMDRECHLVNRRVVINLLEEE